MRILIKSERFQAHSKKIFRKVGEASVAALLAVVIGGAVESAAAVDLNCWAYNLNLQAECPQVFNCDLNFNRIEQQVAAGLEREGHDESELESLIIDRVILKNMSLYAPELAERNAAFNKLLVIEGGINSLTAGRPIHVDGKKVWDVADYFQNEINCRDQEIIALRQQYESSALTPTAQNNLKHDLDQHFNARTELMAKMNFLDSYLETAQTPTAYVPTYSSEFSRARRNPAPQAER